MADKALDSVVSEWLDEIETSKKREKDFRKDGQRILDIYTGKKGVPFNILFSNTETLFPALYSLVPRPVVQRRYKDNDPTGKAASEAGQRVLQFLLDTNVEGYETFDIGMRFATLDALLPGRGVTTVKYDAEILDVESPTEEGEQEAVTESYKQSELVCIDSKHWNKVYFGYAKKWSKVPWIAYEEYIDKEEATRLFGEDIAKEISYSEEEGKEEDGEKQKTNRDTALIYQIWDKTKKKILYISPQYPDGYLKVADDELKLTGFYNCPRPIQFMEKSGDLLPTAMYLLYENQAEELNEITRRISRLVRAIKARFIYDSALGDDIKNLFEADDNEGIPAEATSSLAADKGFQNALWFAPLQELIATLQQLYTAREGCKQVIYEITGIADIMRGQTAASETLGAQQIKQSWGTLRLKRLQKEVQRYARDLLRMMLEMASTKFSEDTWAKMTGLPYLTTEQEAQLEAIALAAKMSGQPLDEQTQAALQTPRWSKVLELLKNDIQRSYRVDIETNSTVEPEAVEDQKNITELMGALGQLLNGMGPLVAKGVLPWQAAQSMMLAIVRRYRFGSEIEDQITAMQAPKEEDPKAAEQAKMQQEAQIRQAEMAHEAQLKQAEEQRIGMVEMGKHQREQEAQQNTMQIENNRIQAERENKIMDIQSEQEMFAAKLQAERESDQLKAQMTQETELRKASIAAAAQIQIAQINAHCQMMKDQESMEQEANDSLAEDQAKGEKNDAMSQTLEAIAESLMALSAPKVGKFSDGRTITISPQVN